MNIIETAFKWNGNLTYGNTPKKIILHHAESKSCSVYDIHSWHLNNGWTGIGYHFFVRKDGRVFRGRPENCIGAHVSGANTNTLGICAEGSYMTETMPDAQYNAIVETISYLDNKYGKLPIYGHKEVGSSNCPGVNFPLAKLKNRESVVDNSTASPVPPASNETKDRVSIAKDYLASSNKIKTVQLVLNCVGYNLSVDEICGTQTASAIGEFQKKYNLSVDYMFGPKCFEKAYNVIKDRLCKRGCKNTETSLIQHLLGINADGIFGTQTENAVKNFQKSKGLSQDGMVGALTWKALLL